MVYVVLVTERGVALRNGSSRSDYPTLSAVISCTTYISFKFQYLYYEGTCALFYEHNDAKRKKNHVCLYGNEWNGRHVACIAWQRTWVLLYWRDEFCGLPVRYKRPPTNYAVNECQQSSERGFFFFFFSDERVPKPLNSVDKTLLEKRKY